MDIGLTPVGSFDFQKYTGVTLYLFQEWCRYCGSRYAKSFREGPWGKDTLCVHHFELWRTKRITIPDVDNPTAPIHLDKETEIKYLNEYMNLHPKITVNELLGVLDTLKGENN